MERHEFVLRNWVISRKRLLYFGTVHRGVALLRNDVGSDMIMLDIKNIYYYCTMYQLQKRLISCNGT